MKIAISYTTEQWPLKSVFRIARGAKTQADVVVATLSVGAYQGRAEAVPYGRYGESVASVLAQLEQLSVSYNESNQDLTTLIAAMPAGAARNVLDCAMWQLKAQQQQTGVAALLNLTPATAVICAQTLSIDTPEAMADAVTQLNNPPLVKVKLDNQEIITKMRAINRAAPNSQFIVDANEGWTIDDLHQCHQQLAQLNVVLIEQPLPAGDDEQLKGFSSAVPLCADESCHTSADLDQLKDSYQVINIKLDKTGGLTEAVKLAKLAQAQGFELMLGCMVGSSLAMAPATLLTPMAQFVDLDGPLLIAKDHPNGLAFNGGIMQPLKPDFWG